MAGFRAVISAVVLPRRGAGAGSESQARMQHAFDGEVGGARMLEVFGSSWVR